MHYIRPRGNNRKNATDTVNAKTAHITDTLQSVPTSKIYNKLTINKL